MTIIKDHMGCHTGYPSTTTCNIQIYRNRTRELRKANCEVGETCRPDCQAKIHCFPHFPIWKYFLGKLCSSLGFVPFGERNASREREIDCEDECACVQIIVGLKVGCAKMLTGLATENMKV